MIKTFTCKYCHKPFTRQVFPSRNTFEFCSPACRNKARMLKPIKCPVCGTLFAPRINDTGGVRKRYCSAKCGTFAQRGKRSGNPKTHSTDNKNFIKKHYPKMGAEWVAEKLGFTKSAIYNLANRLGVGLEKSVYKEKVHGAARRYMTGERNPNWQGGGTYLEWGDNWLEQKKKTRKRDNYTCQICGKKDRFMPVHHIKPRRLFKGHVEDANVLSNLICLCPTHHLLVEIGKIPCPTPKS